MKIPIMSRHQDLAECRKKMKASEAERQQPVGMRARRFWETSRQRSCSSHSSNRGDACWLAGRSGRWDFFLFVIFYENNCSMDWRLSRPHPWCSTPYGLPLGAFWGGQVTGMVSWAWRSGCQTKQFESNCDPRRNVSIDASGYAGPVSLIPLQSEAPRLEYKQLAREEQDPQLTLICTVHECRQRDGDEHPREMASRSGTSLLFQHFFKKLSLGQKSAGGTSAALQNSNVLIQHSGKAIWMMIFFPIL